MIFVCILFIVVHFFLSGMLTSAIMVDLVEGRPSNWKILTFAPVCFLFGLYYLIALIGYESQLCSG